MRVVYMGTPQFAVPVLEAIVDAGHEVVLVVTQPDRPGGRGLKTGSSPVKAFAETRGLPVAQPATGSELYRALREARAEVGAVAAYGRLIGPKTLALPKAGCLAVHPSLLPKYRGAAPVQRALMSGEEVTGVTIIQVTPTFDAGPILAQAPLAVEPEETAGSLLDRLARLGADLMVETLSELAAGTLRPRAQDEGKVTYAPLIAPEDEWLDFHRPGRDLANQVRALNPWPVCRTVRRGKDLKVWRADPRPPGEGMAPGTVAGLGPQGLVVACGAGTDRVALTEVQPANGRRMRADEYARGHRVEPGEVLGQPHPD
ncbi:MAG: methionyl-tRNA formyltransferase [Bacillota bacterium]